MNNTRNNVKAALGNLWLETFVPQFSLGPDLCCEMVDLGLLAVAGFSCFWQESWGRILEWQRNIWQRSAEVIWVLSGSFKGCIWSFDLFQNLRGKKKMGELVVLLSKWKCEAVPGNHLDFQSFFKGKGSLLVCRGWMKCAPKGRFSYHHSQETCEELNKGEKTLLWTKQRCRTRFYRSPPLLTKYKPENDQDYGAWAWRYPEQLEPDPCTAFARLSSCFASFLWWNRIRVI